MRATGVTCEAKLCQTVDGTLDGKTASSIEKDTFSLFTRFLLTFLPGLLPRCLPGFAGAIVDDVLGCDDASEANTG